MTKRGKNSKNAVSIARKELKKHKTEEIVEFFLLFFTLLSASALLLLLSFNLITTGYSTYAPGKAGYITELDVTLAFQTYYWHGLYGLALRVPGYTDPLFETIAPGEITSAGLFFDCMEQDVIGGREIYASTSPVIYFDNLQPATTTMVDDYLGCSGTQCGSGTFTETMSVMVGATNITGIPSTHTYRWDGENGIFDIGVLNDSVNLVYVSHIQELQKGYSPNTTVNFQMLLPVPANTTETYHFFTDPNDICPEGGGIGEVIDAYVYGHIRDELGNPVENATTILTGITNLSDSEGIYNLSVGVISGTYILVVTATGYEDFFTDVIINSTQYYVEKDVVLIEESEEGEMALFIEPVIWGYVKDSSGNGINLVNISLGGGSVVSDSDGYYELFPSIFPEIYPIIAFKTGYNNYYHFLNFSEDTTEVNHNITMIVANTKAFDTGPYSPPRKKVKQIKEEAEKNGEDYWLSSKEIVKEVRQNTFVEETIGIYNFKKSPMNLVFSISEELEDFVKLDRDALSVNTNEGGDLVITIYGNKPIGHYEGVLEIKGDLTKEIPIKISIVEKNIPIETLLMNLDLFEESIQPGNVLKYKLTMQNLLREQNYEVNLETSVRSVNGSKVYLTERDEVEIAKSLSLLKEMQIPENFTEGSYLLQVDASHFNLISSIVAPFRIYKPVYLYSFLGIPVWLFLAFVSFVGFIMLNLFLYRKYQEKKKRYSISLETKTLPKAEKNNFFLGWVAETKIGAYIEPERLKTHTIVAGATGMGKSISAQVLIEEALMKNVAVIVFDPTAQWSGLLRKCDDKKMMSYYPKFKLKPSDARAFPGNIRQVSDAREIIEIQKYINPGQIQIFTLNKLDPKDIDIFVANVIRQIFKSDPKEQQELKVLLVFDEVHRLLSKFGGSGEGFLQIERACREFRKWGMGLVLISQVLSDFVGEIKANINTEIQTRTIEESDLERIKTKYGEEFLKSLVRAEVGVAMFQNAEYNKGKPYFVNFRPILHNTRRLPDEELEKYNKYNEVVDDMVYQVEQLEQLKIDVFDLKMEMKLIKDKVMTGNFSVVDIYLEGLKPRLEKQWQKLGKKPKKLVKKLADVSEIKKSVEEAKKARASFEKEQKKKIPVKKQINSSKLLPKPVDNKNPVLDKKLK